MDTNVASFVGSIPQDYDAGLGPIIFEPYAQDIARRAAALSPTRMLETAAGTGIVTRRLRDAMPPSANLMATDLNMPMLEVARGKFAPDELVALQPADATELPFEDASFDTVVCQFGLMFYPDKAKSFREVHRVLAPGGHYLFSVWDSHAWNPFGRIAHENVERFFPDDPPQFYKVPFSCHAIDPVKQWLLESGFSDIEVAVLSMEREIPDVRAFARGLVYGNPLIDQIRARGTVAPEKVFDRLVSELRNAFGEDPGRMPTQVMVYQARK